MQRSNLILFTRDDSFCKSVSDRPKSVSKSVSDRLTDLLTDLVTFTGDDLSLVSTLIRGLLIWGGGFGHRAKLSVKNY